MPSTWTARNKKKTVCQASELEEYSCAEDSSEIVRGEVVVKVKPSKGYTMTFHPGCWLEVAVTETEKQPVEDTALGRRSLNLTEEEKTVRHKLMARHSSFGARIRQYNLRLNQGEDNEVLALRIEALRKNQDRIWWQIQDYGGAPDNWRIPENGEEYLRQKALSESKSNDQPEQDGGVQEQQDVAV